MPMFYPDDLQRTIDEQQIDARLIRTLESTPTVAAAAAVLGVMPEQIAKTLLFAVDAPTLSEGYVVVISFGERRVDKALIAGEFGVGKKRVGMASPEKVIELVGYPAGGVPPFGHATQLPVLLDAELAARPLASVLYAGGGDDNTMLEITVDELLRVVKPRVVTLA